MLFLAGDIGGTKALLQLIVYRPETDTTTELGRHRYLCAEFDSLAAIVQTFLDTFHPSRTPIDSACFGLPGPVGGRRVKLTNLPWIADADQLERLCALRSVLFVNDFFAAAMGVQALPPEQLHALFSKEALPDLTRNHLVIGAGTGLGVAPVCAGAERALPVPSEGGHFEFAPISETQLCLLDWLWQTHAHVSYERVLSGPGLETLYQFFCQFDLPSTYVVNVVDGSQNLKKSRLKKRDNEILRCTHDRCRNAGLSASQIARAADQGDPVAVKALTEFVTIYGAFAGAASLARMFHEFVLRLRSALVSQGNFRRSVVSVITTD